MIVFKNYFEKTYAKSDDFKEPIYFQINNTNMKITKNYPQLHEIIKNIKISQNKSEIYKILIPNLVQNKITITNNEYYDDYTSYEDKHSSVTISNYDRQDIYQDQKSNSYEQDLFYHNLNRPQTCNYFENDNDNTNNISPIIDHQHNTMIKKIYLPRPTPYFLRSETESSIEANSFVIEQFQLILDGYDIIIPDFLVDDMIKIAENLHINELFDAIDPLKEQIKDLENYNEFSELEILIFFEDILTTIDDSNFEIKSSIIFSIFLYIENGLFKSILYYYSLLYRSKYPTYLKIAKMIKSKYQSFDFKIDFNNESKGSYNYFDNYRKINHTNENLLRIIRNDDAESLQKLSCNPLFNFSEEKVKLNIYKSFNHIKFEPICNAIECSAFYGSIKCFKFLVLNVQLESTNLSKYAVAGGNAEIIHYCEQNKYSFENTLKIAIDYHQNDIVEWIVDNNKDKILEDIFQTCIKANNFKMLQFFLSRKSELTIKDSKILVKYVMYNAQKSNISFTATDLLYFLMKFKSFPLKNEFGLIYCPNEKVEILDMIFREK